MNEKVSLMMVTYNRLALTKQTIANLAENTVTKHNLIIVDNGSSDGTVEFFEKEFSPYKSLEKFEFIKNVQNKGIAIGRNQTLKKAIELGSKFFCTFDNDVLIPKFFIRDCLDIMSANPCYCMGVNFEGKKYPTVTKNGKTFQEKPQGNPGTACAMFNDRLQKMIGFFNTSYGKYSHEDADYFFRARVVGFKVGYLLENGVHLGVGEQDQGEYREFKTKSFNDNLQNYYKDSHLYVKKQKSIYIPYKD